MQRVNFEPIPGTRHDQYAFKLRLVLGFITQPGGNKFKAFRDFMRKQNLWDKDKGEDLFSLVEITWDKKDVKLGKTAKKLASAHSDVDFQNVLFERLKEVNLLLVKYVLEALDVQQGGRLHSVHELYRMITSYVYPGTYINLTSFQAWIEWMAASAFIKLVGIRWALSEKGQKVVGELRSMDVDEILEDMADEGDGGDDDDDDAGGDDDDDDDDDAPPPPKAKAAAPPAPAPAAAKPKAKAPVDDDDDEDLFDDLPPEPDAPDEDAIAAASKRLGLDDDDEPPAEDVPKPARPKYSPPASLAAKKPAAAPAKGAPAAAPVAVAAAPAAALHMPAGQQGYVVGAPVAFESTSVDELSDKLLALHRGLGAWPELSAPALHVEHDASRGDMAILVELGVMAALVEGLAPQPQLFAFARRLSETAFFVKLGHGEGLEDALDAVVAQGEEPWARPLIERLVHARFIARRASSKIDLLYQIRNAESGGDAVKLLREHLTGPSFAEAPFWVLRELVRLGVVGDAGKVGDAVVVPTRALVRAAVKVGLAGAAPSDFAGYLAVSAAASKVAGSVEHGYGAALERLDDALGLR